MKNFLLPATAALVLLVTAYWTSSATSDKQQPAAEQGPKIVAAGTAVWKLGKVQDNATAVRVQLKEEITAKIGENYIVLLTPRFSGFPYYVPYWKKAKDGFDITLIDPALAQGGSVSYLYKVNQEFPVDWIVVRKE